MTTRLVVTSRTGLVGKYGEVGYERIRAAACTAPAGSDRADLETVWAALDDATTLASWQVEPVADATSPEQVKACYDALVARVAPAFVMLLGAQDVVPYQTLTNPIQADPATKARYGTYDPSPTIPSDLPYASPGVSRQVRDFLGPTWVVGRLPDLPLPGPGREEALAYLLALLEGVRTAPEPTDAAAYRTPFALSSAEVEPSTERSVGEACDGTPAVQATPRGGPHWPGDLWARRLHYVNCHGGASQAFFEGTDGTTWQHALEATDVLAHRLAPGTVVVAECCFGSQVFAYGQTMSVASAYLKSGAVGFVGATDVSYGAQADPSGCDLLCRDVVERLLAGATLGRALLEARHAFHPEDAPIGPVNLKNLAIFNLIGDPSVRPARVAVVGGGSTAGAPDRTASRSLLVRQGERLKSSTHFPHPAAASDPTHPVVRDLLARLEQAGLEPDHVSQHEVHHPTRGAAGGRFHLVGGHAPDGPEGHHVLFEALEHPDGRVDLREYRRR